MSSSSGVSMSAAAGETVPPGTMRAVAHSNPPPPHPRANAAPTRPCPEARSEARGCRCPGPQTLCQRGGDVAPRGLPGKLTTLPRAAVCVGWAGLQDAKRGRLVQVAHATDVQEPHVGCFVVHQGHVAAFACWSAAWQPGCWVHHAAHWRLHFRHLFAGLWPPGHPCPLPAALRSECRCRSCGRP
jgi:hypothetical protein